MSNAVSVGVIGCGNISDAYFKASSSFPNIKLTKVADLRMEAAGEKAEKWNFEAVTVDELLADKDISIVLNLTTPQSHTQINEKILKSGKHAYTEKPFGLDRESGRWVLELAESLNLQTGGAPDTFLGGAHQTCRKLIDEGRIGRVVAGTAFMMCPGHESWHPNPGFYYLKGGGPLFDMGPYYLTALVNMLGSVKRVGAMGSRKTAERMATSPAAYGRVLPVEVDTHIAALVEFECGAIVTLITSFDVYKHTNGWIELHGTEGSLQVPDPNCFGGEVKIFQPWMADWVKVKNVFPYNDNMRSIGLADMAQSIEDGSLPRCSGKLAFHVLDVMCSIVESAERGEMVKVSSRCERPRIFPDNLQFGKLK